MRADRGASQTTWGGGAHGIAMRADPRRLADDRHIKMGNHAGAGANALACERQETVRRSAAPLRIAGRKVHPDIALGERPQDRVHQRMQRNVRIRMSGDAARVRNAHARQHDVIAVAERVHVETASGTHIAERRHLQRLGALEIVVCRQFHVAAFAGEDINRMACPFGKRRVVGKIVPAGRRGAAVKFDDNVIGERLRRLHRAQAAAVKRFTDHVPLVDLLDGIRNGNGRHSGAVRLRRSDGARDQIAAEKRPGGIMDQHQLGRGSTQRIKPGADRCLARGAARNRRHQTL